MRTSYFEDDSHRLLFCVISKSSTHDDCTSIEFVWRNSALPWVKFFGWLLTHRIHCRTSLVRKHILQDAHCEICCASDKAADHIFFGSYFVRTFWELIGWRPNGILNVT